MRKLGRWMLTGLAWVAWAAGWALMGLAGSVGVVILVDVLDGYALAEAVGRVVLVLGAMAGCIVGGALFAACFITARDAWMAARHRAMASIGKKTPEAHFMWEY